MPESSTTHRKTAALVGLLQLMRPRQWVKNVFVLAPLVFAGEFLHPVSLVSAIVAMALFCVASSATYIVNDLHDVERDRKHPTKSKKRPLAAGTVTTVQAVVLLVLLYVVLIYGYVLLPAAVKVIAMYVLLNVAYTFVLKHQPVLDIFTIAIGFVLRVYAGAMALSVPVSSWMFITTLCLALFLAAVKRRQEIDQVGTEGRKVLEKYTVALVERYAEMSATGALLFYSLFVMNTHPKMVFTIPFVLFGLFRYWFVVESLKEGESPTDVLLSDGQLLLTVVLWVISCVWGIWPA